MIAKLQRPGLEDIVRRDSAVLSFVARQLDRRVEVARRVGIRDLADELITSIEAELDYGREVVAGLRLRENLGTDNGVRVPVVHPTLSSRRLLVMDEIVGKSISNTAAIDAAPVGRRELAQQQLASFLAQILRRSPSGQRLHRPRRRSVAARLWSGGTHRSDISGIASSHRARVLVA